MSSQGLLIVVSGPSGVGKTTICRALVERLGAELSISTTTRPPGQGERDGQDYFFLSPQEFQKRLSRNEFLEYAEVFGHLYGTLAKPVLDSLSAGRIVVLEIDVNGAKQVRQRFERALMFLILPPAPGTLGHRLNNRGRDAGAVIAERLAKADGEIRFALESKCYDHTIVNDDLEEAIDRIVTVIKQEREKAQND
ncbi:MAG: guanylate kinase [Actinobacteria bacterium]|nr:guanylate kinase [Actinomycetota bacterium]